MSQPSVANYFATRKRNAIDESNVIRAKKVLVLDPEDEAAGNKRGINKKPLDDGQVTTRDHIFSEAKEKSVKKELMMAIDNKTIHSSEKDTKFPQRSRVVAKLDFDTSKAVEVTMSAKKSVSVKPKHKKLNNQADIQKIFQNMQNKSSNIDNNGNQKKVFVQRNNIQKINEKTPPGSPVKSAMDKVVTSELSISEIKTKLTRSARLAELKASITRFNKSADQLKAAEKKTEAIQGPSLNKFKSIQLEVQLSPKKSHSPAKPYLSPMKDAASPRKNLFGMKSPVKSPLTSPVKLAAYQRFQSLASSGKPTLTLPYNYRSLAELFRSIDTVCSILFNRKETITFSKVKPAVQEMIRRNLDEQHFAQIKSLYPDAFSLSREKMRTFASGTREEKYELVIKPNITSSGESDAIMNPNVLLERRRNLFNILLEKVKHYHNEFLLALDPPMIIPPEKLTRWHPEFDIEKVPEIAKAEIPQPPEEEKLTTGQEVLEKARNLFNCNTRMERALEKLKKVQEERATATQTSETVTPAPAPVSSALKGIPQSLLEKVRAKQAAKALEAMTRSTNQDKESLIYARLPDIARLMRNTYVAERKGVLALEEVIVKLNNSYRSHMSNSEIEQHLRMIAKCVPGWLVFHEIRGTLFVKLSRDGDMKKVMTRLEQLAKEKAGT